MCEKIPEVFQAINNKDGFAPADSLAGTIIEMRQYFMTLGYGVPSDFPEQIFSIFSRIIPERDNPFQSFEEIAPVVKTLIAKSETEYRSFDADYKNFLKMRNIIVISGKDAREIEGLKMLQSGYESDLRSIERQAERREKKLENLQKNDGKDEGVISEKTAEKMEKELKAVMKSYKKAYGTSKRFEQMKTLHFAAAGMSQDKKGNQIPKTNLKAIKEIKKALKEGLPGIPKNADFIKTLSFVSEQEKLLTQMQKDLENPVEQKIENTKKELEKLASDKSEIQEKLNQTFENIDSGIQKIMKKDLSNKHRPSFETRGHSVQSTFHGKAAFQKEFQSLSDSDKESIREYILDNAKKFRTKLSRNIRTGHRAKLNMPQTCKYACATNGVPIRLVYEKPKRQKTKLIMFLDVSGSCSDASELMLTFMHEMREVFPGGCKSYAFVNSLYDISDFFNVRDSEKAIENILNTIPRRGVYSNYGEPLRDFCENHFSDITKDTIVFWIGDARNNNMDPEKERFKAISKKARSVYWLNTEEKAKWNKNDSIINVYGQYCNTVLQTTTPGELIDFLVEMR